MQKSLEELKFKIEVADGKFTLEFDPERGMKALRYGQMWQDLTGNGLVLAMAQEIIALREKTGKTN